MAIYTDIIDERGYLYSNQYVRIEKVSITNKIYLDVELGVYFTKQDASTGGYPHRIENIRGEYDLLSSKTPWEQAYDLIKTRYHIYVDDI
jgi:hypothetical protein